MNIEAAKKAIAIFGKTNRPELAEGEQYLYFEFPVGEFRRVINLPEAIAHTDVKADYAHGILTVINGGVGDDNLWGGLESDTLTGGDDADKFIIARQTDQGVWITDLAEYGVDTITDFDWTEEDKLVLWGGFWSGLGITSTTDSSEFRLERNFTSNTDQLFFEPSGGDSTLILTSTFDDATNTEQLYFNAPDGASVLIAEFTNLNSHGDFIPSPEPAYDIEFT